MTAEIEIATPARLGARFVARLSHEARQAIAARGRFLLAVAGGSVTERIVPAWIAADVDWSRCDILWVDERAVPPEHSDSNFGLAWRRGLDRLPAVRVHRLHAEGDDLEGAAAAAEVDLRELLGAPARVDLALVGVGDDGHVASLFPGHPALAERERWIVAVDDAPKPPPRRLTWTLRAFSAVDLLVVAAFGAAKAAAVAAAREPERSELPIARVARAASRRWLLVDDAAAGR
jgi:6-phosphogluconolactonase